MLITGLNTFKDIHEDEKVFMVGTGPSLTYEMLDQLEGQYTFAMNNIAIAFPHTKWRPYYYLNVSRSLLKYGHWAKCATEAVQTAKHTFYWCRNLPHAGRAEHADCKFTLLSCHNYPVFELDCWENVSRFGSSMFTALQLAIYMGFRRIYLIGCDLGYLDGADPTKMRDNAHFDNDYLGKERREWMIMHKASLALDELRTLVAHQLTAVKVFSMGGFVVTCTPRLERIYPRMDFEDALRDDGSWYEAESFRELAG